MSQKGCRTTKKINQNWINIYVLPFTAMAIMANYYFFILMNVKEIKNPIDGTLNLNFDSQPLKVHTYGVKQKPILQRNIKSTHIIKHI
jgi:hypothetical protein